MSTGQTAGNSRPSSAEPGRLDYTPGDLSHAGDTTSRARESLSAETRRLAAARKVMDSGDYRTVDQNGNPLDPEKEQRRVAAQVRELEQRVARARADLDAAEGFEVALDGGQL